MTDVALGVVHGERVDAEFCFSLAETCASIPLRRIHQLCGPMVDKGRNAIVEAFLSSPAEYLMFIDSDMVFSPQDVVDLVAKAAPDRIISGTCLARDGHIAARVRRDDKWWVVNDPGDQVMRVDYVGAAFTIAPREAYEKVAANHPGPRPWYAFTERYGGTVGEDAEFCLRAADEGFAILLDGTVRPVHNKVQPVRSA